jgi:hypothetical protein
VLFADIIYLKSGIVLRGKVDHIEENTIYFRTALGTEKIDKMQIWKMVDDNNAILYENPANKPASIQEQSNTTVQPETPQLAPQTQSNTLMGMTVDLESSKRVALGFTAGIYRLTNKDYNDLWEGTLGGTYTVDGTVFIIGNWGLMAGYNFFSTKIKPKHWGNNPPEYDMKHHIFRSGLVYGKLPLSLMAGYVSKKSKVTGPLSTEEGTATGTFIQLAIRIPFDQAMTICGQIIFTADLSGGDNLGSGAGMLFGMAIII